MIYFITGAAGSGKSTEMIRFINKESDTGREICIIVPEQFSYEFDKNLYKSIGPKKFNKLFSLSFTSISRQLFQFYGDVKRKGKYADETARMILIYQALGAALKNPASKRFFEKQSSHIGFAEETLKLICEMKKSGITPEQLREKSVLLDQKLMDKTNDISIIFLEYERLMSEYGFKDNLDDIKEAAEIANLHGYFSGKSVFLDEFESFTGDQIEFIRTIISGAENVYITLRTEDVNAGEFTLFETVNDTYCAIADICRDLGEKFVNIKCSGCYRFSNPDIAYLSTNILRNKNNSETDSPPTADNIKIFEAKDFYSEAEYVCASIKRMVYENENLKYNDIAVISNNIEDYAEVLEAAFERYEIPYFLSLEKPVMHTSIMIFFSTLMNIATGKTYNSELLFRYMKCGLINVSLTDIAKLENYCYKWGIDGKIWESKFTAPDEDLELLEQIRNSVIFPLASLRSKLSRRSDAEQLCRCIYDYITACGAEKNVSRLMGNLILENKDHEAAEVKRLWSCLMDILDSIVETIGGCEITAAELRRIINSLIGRISYSLPPQTLDSVTAASARTARLNSPKVVFVMGANDGNFPNTVNLHGIFSETDKQKLAETGVEISRRLPELIAAERLVVYKSLSAASERVVITYPLSDLSGQQKYAAPIIESILKLFNDPNIRISESQISPDYYAVTMKSAFYHYMQNLKLNNASTASIKKILMDDMDYKRKLLHIMSGSRERDKYRIDTALIEKLKRFDPMQISPSSFELYNKCHFQYFCRECLRLIIREKVDLDVRYSGNIIHDCFYNIISSRSKEEFVGLSYDRLKQEISDSASAYLEKNMGGDFAKNPRFELGFKKLAERLVRVFVHTQQEFMASEFEPHAFEINLRDENVNSSLSLPFSSGKRLNFGGIIDRADVCTINGKKYIRIVDYKSSAKNIDKYTLTNGINMQMLLYLFAITDKGGVFEEYSPAGVLYSPVTISSVKTEDVRNDTENQAVINAGLKTSGLVLGDKNVLAAMEHDISGNYIPAKLDKMNEIDKKSSCLSKTAFQQLKQFSYKKLIEMAESVYSGDADANPLITDALSTPCDYCEYSHVCGNTPLTRFREAHSADTAQAEAILDNKTDKENDDNGLD